MSIEAMKQMLEALERMKSFGNTFLYKPNERSPYEQACEAITAGRQAIEQAEEQEPVADTLVRAYVAALIANNPDEAADATRKMVDYTYTTSQPKLEKRESVPVCEYCEKERPVIHAPQPQREWVGLTDEELKQICAENHIMLGAYAVDFIRAIEAKLREKNT